MSVNGKTLFSVLEHTFEHCVVASLPTEPILWKSELDVPLKKERKSYSHQRLERSKLTSKAIGPADSSVISLGMQNRPLRKSSISQYYSFAIVLWPGFRLIAE
jgi:hypothetical protein